MREETLVKRKAPVKQPRLSSHSTLSLPATPTLTSIISTISPSPLPPALILPPSPSAGSRRGPDATYPTQSTIAGIQSEVGSVEGLGLPFTLAAGAEGGEESEEQRVQQTERRKGSETQQTLEHLPRRSTRVASSCVPSETPDLLRALSAAVLKVIADGRCSVASVLLALGHISLDHNNQASRQAIDQARRQLGESIRNDWTSEQEWIDEVPVDLRMPHARLGQDGADNVLQQSSFTTIHTLLTEGSPTAWLDHTVFYLTSRMYNVGVIIVVPARRGVPLYCRRIGARRSRHVVLFHRGIHYECVRWGETTVFPSEHPLISHLVLLNVTHPPVSFHEDDLELLHLRAQTPAVAPKVVRVEGSGTEPSPPPGMKRTAVKSKRKKAVKATRSAELKDASGGSHKERKSARSTGASPPLPISGDLLSAAEIAAHGELYEYISFPNVPQWVAICTLVLNTYRVASQAGDKAGQQQALEDLLMLPQRVLTRTSRGGDPRRLTSTIRARCKGVELRMRYGCIQARDDNVKLTVSTAALLHHPSRSPTAAWDPSTADTDIDTEVQTESESEEVSDATRPLLSVTSSIASTVVLHPAAHKEDNCINNDEGESEEETHNDEDYVRSFLRQTVTANDSDQQAARRAQHHVRKGHLSKAAQILYSTATMADLRQPEVQAALRALHPNLPEGSSVPLLPGNSPLMILEDDEVMAQLLRQSNNGSASGPSGWGGNMLSSLAESDVCRAGIIALLKDIINGNLPDHARQLLLACRAVALNKPSGGYRPIAVGELFYRLAGVIVVRKITGAAASLLAPHQYGVGVPSGAERILHSLQHTLSDKSKKLALLKIDIANAFNACDRARVLRELYATPQLSPMFRMADFGYAVPSELLLQRCEGLSIPSSNGVRQGDPLSAVLFCLYMRPILAQVSEEADVQLYAFFDDVNVVGTPEQVMKALTVLQRILPKASLRCNTSKSHFAYFHQDESPLLRSVRDTLADQDIHFHDDWVDVVGAVVGRDEAAIRAGIEATLGSDVGRDAFFYRLQLGQLSAMSSMLLLRQCAVPRMNYALRCLPPSCIAQQAEVFDEQVLRAAKTVLNLHADEGWEETDRILRVKLRHGGFGLTSAVRTSPAAFLGSLAAVSSAPVFAPYRKADCPLPSDAPLHAWIDSSISALTATTPQSAELLPSTASTFFQHFSKPSSSSSLQHALSSQADQHSHQASLKYAQEMKKKDKGAALAHLKAICAPRAWAWKMVVPSMKEMELTDVQYRMAARQNLRLLPGGGAAALPADCPSCKKQDALTRDPWHFLSCKKQHGREQTRRHDEVVRALYRTALVLGLQAACEPAGLYAEDGRRPDLQLVLPGRHILTDVAVCHPLGPGAVNSGNALTTTGVARHKETKKRRKYCELTKQQDAEMLPFVVETTGGMAPDAIRLLRIMGEAGQEHLAMWPKHEVIRHLVGSVAIAVQRGMVMTYLAGYERAIAQLSGRVQKKGQRQEE